MSEQMTFPADVIRRHHLPRAWDGEHVTWSPWERPQGHICPPPKYDPCGRCTADLSQAPTSIGSTAESKVRFVACRCIDCGQDHVTDTSDWTYWVLDASDYGIEGSVDPRYPTRKTPILSVITTNKQGDKEIK